MKSQDVVSSIKNAAAMGYEQGYGQALHFIKEFIDDGRHAPELKTLSPDMKKHIRLLLLVLEGYAEPARMEFIGRLRCEIALADDDMPISQ